MRPSLGTSSLAVLRSIAGLTQQQLSDLVDCSRPTVQAIELGKLSLSRGLAERISFHTGINPVWLLDNRYTIPPNCRDHPDHPYTKEVFDKARMALTNPRTAAAPLIIQMVNPRL